MVDIDREANSHTTVMRSAYRAADDPSRLWAKLEVVLRQIKRARGTVDERRDQVCDLKRRLPTVGQSTHRDEGIHA